MGIDSGANVSGVEPYGGKSAFTQLEHNIVAAYLITAGNEEKNSLSFVLVMGPFCFLFCSVYSSIFSLCEYY